MRLDKTIFKIISNNRFSSILDNKKLYVFCFHSVSDNPSNFTYINNIIIYGNSDKNNNSKANLGKDDSYQTNGLS